MPFAEFTGKIRPDKFSKLIAGQNATVFDHPFLDKEIIGFICFSNNRFVFALSETGRLWY
jgi:hypothetical protein